VYNLLNKFYSDAWLKDLLDNVHDLIQIAHEDGTLLYANRTWSTLLGYSPNDILNKSTYLFVHPAERAYYKTYRENIIKGIDIARPVVITVIAASGKELKVEGLISLMKRDGITYTTGIFRDITMRLQNEAQLQKSYNEIEEREKSLSNALQHAPDAVVLIDKQGEIIFWNSKSEKIFGWLSDEVIGRHLSEVIIPLEYRQAHTEGLRRFLATGEAHVLNKTIEITALNRSGDTFFVALTISQTQWKGNIAFIAFVRDISPQKKAQQELQDKKHELETSNQHLEQFAHVASHDMKEPVRRIKVFTDMLLLKFGDHLPVPAKDYLDKIDKSCTRLIDMVTGVLAYASLHGNNEPIQLIALSEIISSIEQDLELIISEKKASIIYNDLPKLKGVPFLIYQLFYNLVYNALKFSKKDVPCTIEIRSKVADNKDLPEGLDVQAGPYVDISVCDNGIGFDQKNAEIIFDNFTRLHSKDEYEGTGLGLAIVRDAVERHGGKIVATSVPNEGSCFDVFLLAR
jgi:PAS domain S-box-containing protein